MGKINLIFLFVFILQLNESEPSLNNIYNYYKEENENDCIYILNQKMEKENYTITNLTCEYRNNNSELIYIFQTNSTNFNILIDDSKGLNYLNILKYNSSLKINSIDDKEGKIFITSIPNNLSIETLFEEHYDKLYLKQNLMDVKIIETKDDNLIATFDSFDENHKTFYAKYSSEFNPRDIYPINNDTFKSINIKKEIIKLERNSAYIFINDVNELNTTSFEFFISKKEAELNINLEKNTEKYLYLSMNKTHRISLNNSLDSKLIKLSGKTKNSQISIGNNIILNENNIYYELEKGKEYSLTVDKEDALIEILYKFEDEKVYDKIELNEEKIDGDQINKILLKLRTKDDYIIKLKSDGDNSFGASFYGKASKGDYHYYSEEIDKPLTNGKSLEIFINQSNFENININKGEFFSLYLYALKSNKDQPLYLTYHPSHLKTSDLNNANYSYIDLKHDFIYKFNIENDDSYTFKIYLDDNDIQSIKPIFSFDNGTFSNELELVMKNEDKKVPVYINYFKNWTNKNDITMTIIADKSKKILLGIYIVSGIIILLCLVIIFISIRRILNNQQKEISNENELIEKSD